MWYTLENVDQLDSPALVIYKDRVRQNINTLIKSIDDSNRLRPHIKTHKSPEVSSMMMDAGIKKFKCATIAEAEMLASANAPDLLLAYQPVGPKVQRLGKLVQKFPNTKFSCLIDNIETAKHISEIFDALNRTIGVYIDLNVGMNRTGISPSNAFALYEACQSLEGISIIGLHAYDGHLRDPDYQIRKKRSDEAFAEVEDIQKEIEKKYHHKLIIVAGGTPTFSIHSKRKNVECSPGTFIYWDRGYEQLLPEQHYLYAALVVTRVISKPTADSICVDLGHKAIAAENPLQNRVHFLNAEDLEPVGHSEEHMVFKCQKENTYNIGDVLYGVPYHVCPTIALYDNPAIAENNKVVEYWSTISRKRKITV